jgi:integrase
MPHDTRRRQRVQVSERFPAKPRSDGRFQKRIRGTLYYFGANGDRDAALGEYNLVKADLYAGRAVRAAAVTDGTSLKDLFNRVLADWEADVDAGKLESDTHTAQKRTLRRFLKFTGPARPWSDLCPDDFTAYAAHLHRIKLGPYSFNRERAYILAAFNHADGQDWIERAPKFGKGFRRMPLGKMREAKVVRCFESTDVNALLGIASDELFAMILLGLNGGFGPSDCGALPWSRVELANALIRFPRVKNNIPRTMPVWPETLAALRSLRASRPDDELVFRTKYGNAWTDNSVAHEFAKLAERAGLKLEKGVGINACRHTFATLANEVRDTDARRHIMGRKLPNLDDIYVETLFVARLRSVTDHVRQRLGIPEIVGEPGHFKSGK